VQILKGSGSTYLTIKQFGVADPLPDGTVTRIAGVSRYAVGEEIVLFLRDDSPRGFTSPVGLGQGVYRVSRNRARKSVRADAQRAGMQSLDAFLSQVTQSPATRVTTTPAYQR